MSEFPYTIKEYYESDSDRNPISKKKKSSDFFNREKSIIVEERGISFKQTKYICASCMEKLYISGSTNKPRFHFKHHGKEDHSDCCVYENPTLSIEEATRRLFNKRKESLKHKALKNNILAKLEQVGYDCELEQVTRSSENPREWRKADILAKDRKTARKIAVEVQVSYNFLNNILGRGDFYPKQGKYLIWIVEEFNYDLYQQDILFSSPKRNIFVYNDVAKKESEETGKFYLDCYYVTYKIKDDKVIPCDKFEHKLVCFPDDFTFADENKLYAVDTDLQKKEEEDKLAIIKEEEDRVRAEIKEFNKYSDDYLDMEFALQGFVEHIYPDYNKMTIEEFLSIYSNQTRNDKGRADALGDFYKNIFKASHSYYQTEEIRLMLFDKFQSWYKNNIDYIRSQIEIAKDVKKTNKEKADKYILFNCYARVFFYFHKEKRNLFPYEIVDANHQNLYSKFCDWGMLEKLQKKSYIFLRLISPRFGRILSFESDSIGSLNNDILMKEYYHIYEKCLEKCDDKFWVQDYKDRKKVKIIKYQLKAINHDLDDLYKIIFGEEISESSETGV